MVIKIEDTGIGMSADEIPIAMAPFGQIESALSRKNQGTGLGLPLTRALVELHGGTLDLQSQVSLRELVPVDGLIYGEWVIGPGEPAGHRHLQVMIDGVPVADFEFDVGDVRDAGGSGGARKAR